MISILILSALIALLAVIVLLQRGKIVYFQQKYIEEVQRNTKLFSELNRRENK